MRKNNKLWYKEIDKQLDVMRDKIDSHLSKAEKDIADTLGVKVNIKLGNIKYETLGDTVDEVKLAGFNSKIEVKVAGTEKEPIQLKNFAKLLKKEGMIESVSYLTNNTFTDRRHDSVKIIGIDMNKPKNCLQISVNGKKGYQASMGYLVAVAELNSKDNIEKARKFKSQREEHGMVFGQFRNGANGVTDYLTYLLTSKYSEIEAR